MLGSLDYFLRALAVDPANVVIKLSLALAYIHWAFKRQAENRQHLLAQGFAFLMEYYDSRRAADCYLQRQEAEYNVGRAYHLIGLPHLSISYYERCLQLGKRVNDEEGFSREVALVLQAHWATNGDWRRAQEITTTWLTM